MTAAGRLDPQPWMTAPETARVIAALTARGATVRFVGGSVRDALLGRPIRDIDIATHDPPVTVMALLAVAGITAIPTGVAHGTVTVVVGAQHFEITTLREDVETYGRRAKVAFTDDWAVDAARRDFTINAISCAPDGTLFDPVGGLADLRASRVRFVGDPQARIREDVLRLLRFFRFQAHYGKPPADAAARAACRELAPQVPTLSGERVAAELLKLLEAPEPASVVALMVEDGVLAHTLPGSTGAAGVAVLRALVTVEGLGPGADALRRLATLVDPSGGAAAAQLVAERLRLSRADQLRLVALLAPPAAIAWDVPGKAIRRALYRHGGPLVRDLALLAWARAIVERGPSPRHEVEAWQALVRTAEAWRPIALPVRGRDALELGVAPGPAVGRLIEAVEAWWIERDFAPGRDACLEQLAALVRSTAGA